MSNEPYVSRQKRTAKGVVIAVCVVAVIAAVVALLATIERRRETAPAEAGTAASRAVADDAEEYARQLEILGFDEAEIAPVEEDDEPALMLYYNGQPYEFNPALSVLLITGVDDYAITEERAYRTQSQSDLLLVAVFDSDSETCRILQLNRDTMVNDPVLSTSDRLLGLTTEQLAFASTYGSTPQSSAENTVYAVSSLLYGTPIDNYFVFTMEAIAPLNDLVGGVTVDIVDDFSGEDDTLVMGETVTLLGEHAEKYVRARYRMADDPSNIARMQRQSDYILKLVDKYTEAVREDSGFLLTAYDEIADCLVTDCSVDDLLAYGERFSNYELTEIVTPEGEAVKGEKYIEFYVDEQALQQLVLDWFYIPVND